MRIERISVEGMHGMMNASIDFKGELAIVVGVNGAGKTSLLNLMSHLIRLNIQELAVVVFKTLQVNSVSNGRKISIFCQKIDKVIDFKLMEDGDIRYSESYQLPKPDEFGLDSRSGRYAYERTMRKIFDVVASSQLMEFLRTEAKLTLVRLDRTLFAEESDGQIAVDSPLSIRHVQDADVIDPISRVDEVTRAQYNKYRSALKTHNDTLLRSIVLLLFKAPQKLFAPSKSSSRVTAGQIEEVRQKLIKTLFFLEAQEVASQVGEYFDLALVSVNAGKNKVADPENEIARMLFREYEFPRIKGLATAFEDYEKKTAGAFADLEKFIREINSFMVESGKEVFFSEKSGLLKFGLKGGGGGDGRPISDLSSGEKQVVTLFTYLAFMSEPNCIFVVDEPELSLHLSWQMKLVDALLALKPQRAQLILATHSPEIIGKHRRAAVVLTPEYVAS